MKGNPMDWPARPDLEATIAQQQARIEELENEVFVQKGLVTVARVLTDKAEQVLAAERERAEALRAEVDEQEREIRHWAGRNSDLLADLQAEREKSAGLHQRFAEAVQAKERLEALAGLATEMREMKDSVRRGDLDDWADRYDALTTQAPKAK